MSVMDKTVDKSCDTIAKRDNCLLERSLHFLGVNRATAISV